MKAKLELINEIKSIPVIEMMNIIIDNIIMNTNDLLLIINYISHYIKL